MADVIRLADRRPLADGAGTRRSRVVFAFDLASPYTYLAAERVDRLFGDLEYRPVLGEAIERVPVPDPRAEERAAALRMPLVWPEGPLDARPAMRAAAYAAECGKAGAFVLAASRLAFCGGFRLDDPEVLAEVAAAADLGLEACLEAARQVKRDQSMAEEGRRLRDHGADRLPALRVGRTLFCGEDRIGDAVAALRSPQRRRRRAGFAG